MRIRKRWLIAGASLLLWAVIFLVGWTWYAYAEERAVVWVIKPRAAIERDLALFEQLGVLKTKPGDVCYILDGPMIDPPRIYTPPLDDPSFGACAEHEVKHLFGMTHD